MPFDGVFLNHIVNELQGIKKYRISKIKFINDMQFVFVLKYKLHKQLFIDLKNKTIFLSNIEYSFKDINKSFFIMLKKYIHDFLIKDIFQNKSDRVIIISLVGKNELKEEDCYYLVIELTNKPNIILLDKNFYIIDTYLKYVFNNRNLYNSNLYKYPDCKKNIFESLDFNDSGGISLFVKNYIINNNLTLKDIIFNNKYYIFEFNKIDYYCYNFGNIICEFNSASNLLEYYYNNILDSNISYGNNLFNKVNNLLNKYKNKRSILLKEKIEAKNFDKYKLFGELLLSYNNLYEKHDLVNIFNYYNNSYINIKLDNKLTILENSNLYFKKYTKLKKSIDYKDNEIIKTDKDILYLYNILSKISFCDKEDLEQIDYDLINNNYFKNKCNNKKNIIKKDNILRYSYNNSIIIVGKNNIQNEIVSNKLKKNTDLWFHVKDYPGSHVILRNDNNIYNEDDIRMASNIAAYYSYLRHSSSVCVSYTLGKNVRSIKGYKRSYVSIKNEVSIYIDPDIEYINKFCTIID